MNTILTKGQTASLTDAAPEATHLAIGYGWKTLSEDITLDTGAIMVGIDGTAPLDGYVDYENTKYAEGAVRMAPGTGGDQTAIHVDLDTLPAQIMKIVFPLSVFNPGFRDQHLGNVQNMYIRVYVPEAGEEITRFNLADDMEGENAIVFGEMYFHSLEWKFRAVGRYYPTGLKSILGSYSILI